MFADLFEEKKKLKPENVEIGPTDLSIDLLRAVYRNNALYLHIRMRAAISALKHEVPALIATAIVEEGSFAELLDKRLKKISEMKLIESKPINGTVTETQPIFQPEPQPSPPLSNPLSRIYSNRFRRRI